MLSSRFKPYHIPIFLAKYAWLTARRMPVLVNFEVTLRCNARCGFCDYWKTDPSARTQELAGRMQCDTATIWRTCRRYEAAGVDGLLAYAPRSGHPEQISPLGPRPNR